MNGGHTALIWAAIRDRLKLIPLLLEKGGDVTITDKVGFSCLDQAIIHGNYESALLLQKAGLRPKSIDFYELKKEIFVFYKVNVPLFLEKLREECPRNDEIFEKKPSSRQV